jgi:hypothetical protein
MITNLELNLFTGAVTGALTGTFPGTTRQTALAYLAGDMSTSSSAGPPATRDPQRRPIRPVMEGGHRSERRPGHDRFQGGNNIGNFTATFDVSST